MDSEKPKSNVRPYAVKLPAEPGWRVLLAGAKVPKEPMLVPIAAWGLNPPRYGVRAMFDFFGGGNIISMEPLDADGTPFSSYEGYAIGDIAGPDVQDDEVVARAERLFLVTSPEPKKEDQR